jgi:hypothetical protein
MHALHGSVNNTTGGGADPGRLRLSIDVRYQPAADKGEVANCRQGRARTLCARAMLSR